MVKTILVTGATAGIGRATALDLAARGHQVIATGRNETALAALAEVPNIQTARLDVTCPESVAQICQVVDELTAGKGIDVLVNNAGTNQGGPVELVSDADVRAQFDTNFFGVLSVTRAFIPQLRTKGAGRIINISSMVGRISLPLTGIYNASKHALEAASDALRIELKPFGIDVVLIEPGMTKTELGDKMMEGMQPYRQPNTPYYSVMKDMEKWEQRAEQMYADASSVSSVVVHAVEANRVRARYIPGFMNKVSVRLLRNTPTFISDALFRAATGLTKRKLMVG